MKLKSAFCSTLVALAFFGVSVAKGADRIIIGNVSRTIEQLPNYAATEKGFFAQEGIQGDVVLIGSTDTLIQALIAGQVHVAIVGAGGSDFYDSTVLLNRSNFRRSAGVSLINLRRETNGGGAWQKTIRVNTFAICRRPG